MKLNLCLLLTLFLLSNQPANAFFKVETTIKSSKVWFKKQHIKKNKKQLFRNHKVQQTKERKTWLSLPLIGVSFLFFCASVGLFLFAPLSLSFIILLGITGLCFLVFLIVALSVNSWGQERKPK